MKPVLADLHIHTALSACADESMTPAAIVAAAVASGLDMIAICDHNSAGNAAAVQAAAGDALGVIAGMEIQTAEEAHVLGFFPDAGAAERAAREVRATLPEADESYYARFGQQTLLDPAGEPQGRELRALALAAALDVTATVELIKCHGGLAVAAHIDRPSYSVLGQLGFFPHEAGFDGVELSPNTPWNAPQVTAYAAFGLPMLHSSDSHFLDDIGAARSELHVEQASFAELQLALAGEGGRRVRRA